MLQSLQEQSTELVIPPRIVALETSSPHCCVFCVNIEVCNITEWTECRPYHGPPSGPSYPSPSSKPLAISHRLFDWIFQIRGIERVDLYPYRICVFKSPAVNWVEIEELVITAIETLVYPGAEDIEQRNEGPSGISCDEEGEEQYPKTEGDDHAAA